MKWLTLLMVLLLGLGISAGGAAEKSATEPLRPPLPPEGIHVVHPDPGLPADIRAFAGSWYGEWFDPGHPEKGIREMLVVEEIAAKDRVNLIFSWGKCPVCQSQADWRRFTGKIVNLCFDWKKIRGPFANINTDALGDKKVLAFSYPEGRTFIFVLDDAGQLLGTDGEGYIRMSRLE